MTHAKYAADLPPGPRRWPSAQTLRHWHNPLGFEQALLERHGEPFTLRTRPVGPLVVVSDRESVHAVLTGDPGVFQAGRANGRILPILDCESVLLLDGDEHHQRRRVLMPAFRADSVRRLADTIVGETERAIGRWPLGRPFALLPSLRSVTLAVILRAVVDVPDPAVHDQLAARLRQMLGLGSMAALWMSRRRRSWWSPASIFEHHRRAVYTLVGREIRRRRQEHSQVGDVLDLLMMAVDSDGATLTDRSICDEVSTLLMAGYETTSTALAWAFERVLRHPPVLEQARAALSEPGSRYIDALVRESLRSRPPLLDAVRRVANPVAVGGRSIPAGATVMVSVPLVHHRESVYSSPAAFRPERFIGSRPGPSEWVPFGGGQRRCLGADLALLEMTQVITTVLARTELAADRPEPERCRLLGTTLVPSRQASVVLNSRLG